MRKTPGIRRSSIAPSAVPWIAPLALGATALALAVVGAGSGCGRRQGKPAKVPFATQAAYGTPDTCPEDAVDVYGDGTTPGPMDLRCSYSDGTGAILTRVHGRVQIEGPAGSLGPSPGRVRVGIHKLPNKAGAPLGPELAHVVTEPQGTFTLGAMMRPGDVMLVVSDPDDGRTLVQQRISVGGDAGHRLDVQVVIPRPLDDDEPASPPAEGPEAPPTGPLERGPKAPPAGPAKAEAPAGEPER